MIPRTDMVCADIDTPTREMAEVIIKNGHTRIPVYQENRDSIVGILHAKDLLRPLLDGTLEETSIKSILRPPFFISDKSDIKTVLNIFQTGKMHMAIVQDKYGGTAGIVTLEDVIEEIVGEIRDEHDDQEIDEIEKLQDGAFLISGRLSIEELNQALGIELESENVESIGGYIAQMAGRVPTSGEYFNVAGYRFTIQESDLRKIDRMLVQAKDRLN